MTTVFAFVGEHREDPDRLLLLGADGQLYEHHLPDGPITQIEPDDQWTRTCRHPSPTNCWISRHQRPTEEAAMAPEQATTFVPVPDADALDDWLPRAGIVLFFLHDPRCPISVRAYWEVARVGGEVALVDVRAVPSLAGEVERRTGVRHESPQAIALRDGRPIWSASHGSVTTRAIVEATGASAETAVAPERIRGRWSPLTPR